MYKTRPSRNYEIFDTQSNPNFPTELFIGGRHDVTVVTPALFDSSDDMIKQVPLEFFQGTM